MSTDRTPYQEKIIKNYYRNRDALMTQKLQEMIGDLYLAEGKKRAALWKRIATALEKLNVPQPQIDHLIGADNPGLLAEYLKDLLK